MANKMLIDAAHPEETRVVVLRGNRVEDFDFESASKKPLRGNIYLAKVTRVEPSLQAAFIEYGGNRHGFLAFSEIHPDYYQIPVADRQALLDEEARAHREEEDEQRHSGPRRSRRRRHGRDGGRGREGGGDAGGENEAELEASVEETEGADGELSASDVETDAILTPEAAREITSEAVETSHASSAHGDDAAVDVAPAAHGASESPEAEPGNPEDAARSPAMPAAVYEASADRVVEDATAIEPGAPADVGTLDTEAVRAVTADEPRDDFEAPDHASDEAHEENGASEEEAVEQLGGDALEDVPYRTPRLRRHYKIQEVIKRRQILLVQVVKEERGNKGAALTTYLSLAGRYSVLMPNTARGGGISRKITDAEDRKRLKAIAGELEVPEGMGIILRTAGAARGEGEVKRDFEYLLRMWETVRELTLRSSAPTLVYEEGSLVKRAIRDLYSKEIDEIIVAGEGGYREAKEFMRLLMPNQGRAIVPYKDSQPLFAKWGAEAQLDAMFSNHVTLKSGGYLVINQTEALVAIDVNSGRSTREHNIEDTALRTNLEAADEVARQLRLRDLAGLIVVDFIDMEEGRNNRAVERRMKDALKNDRARIQIGRISHFGLLEMSRQRIRTGIMEGSTVLCPHCAGAGTVRSTSSIALHVLRVLEDHLIRSNAFNLIVRTRMEVALYILNQKRAHLTDLEGRFGVTVTVMADATLTGTVYHAIERGEAATPAVMPQTRTPALGYQEADEEPELEPEMDGDEDEGPAEGEGQVDDSARTAGDDEEGGDRRRRRRRRRRGRDRGPSTIAADADQPSDLGMETMARAAGDFPGSELDTDGFRADDGGDEPGERAVDADVVDAAGGEVGKSAAPAIAQEPVTEEAPRRRRNRRATARAATVEGETPEAGEAEVAPVAARRSRRSRARTAVDENAPSLALDAPIDIPASDVVSTERPSADVDIEADTVKNFPGEAETEPSAAAPGTSAPVEAAEPTAEPGPEEPPRPKRSGWWQRAKATITGE